MARALAAVVSAWLLGLGSVAVSGVSATAAPAVPDQDVQAASVETDAVSVEQTERTETSETRVYRRRLHWTHRDDQAVDGDIHLGADFFVGGGGVGADPAFNPVVGGGGFAEASASASASASAHARGRGGSHGGGRHR